MFTALENPVTGSSVSSCYPRAQCHPLSQLQAGVRPFQERSLPCALLSFGAWPAASLGHLPGFSLGAGCRQGCWHLSPPCPVLAHPSRHPPAQSQPLSLDPSARGPLSFPSLFIPSLPFSLPLLYTQFTKQLFLSSQFLFIVQTALSQQ